MTSIEILAIGTQIGQLSAIAIISFTGLALLSALIFLVVSIVQQNKYDSQALPTIADLNPETAESIIEIDEEEVYSAFRFEDDEIDSSPMGNSAADEILKDMRAVEAEPKKSKKFGLFG